MKRFGIHFRLILAVFALVTATTVTLGYIGVTISRQFMQQRFEDRISFLARYLALNAELGVLIGNRDMLAKLANNLLEDADVEHVVIVDDQNEPMADVCRPAANPTLHFVEHPIVVERSLDDSQAFEWESGRDVIGKVRVGYDTAGIDKMLRRMGLYFAMLAAGLSLLFIVVFYFISRSLVSPIDQLARAARRIASGDTELRAQPGHLPETRELAEAFNSMLDSIKWSNKALEEAYQEMIQQKSLAELGKFSLMIAHEVKNPLGIIKSAMDMLVRDHQISREDLMVVYIDDEIKRLNHLIEDFLQFSRPTSPVFQKTDINALVTDCVLRTDVQYNERKKPINCDIPDSCCYIQADADLLMRAISNMIKNAFEASGDSGQIGVSVYNKPGSWTLCIEDEGNGIDPEQLDKVFEPFFTTRSKGTGLGLAFAMEVVKAHGGLIQAKNRDSGGACFTLVLPLADGD